MPLTATFVLHRKLRHLHQLNIWRWTKLIVYRRNIIFALTSSGISNLKVLNVYLRYSHTCMQYSTYFNTISYEFVELCRLLLFGILLFLQTNKPEKVNGYVQQCQHCKLIEAVQNCFFFFLYGPIQLSNVDCPLKLHLDGYVRLCTIASTAGAAHNAAIRHRWHAAHLALPVDVICQPQYLLGQPLFARIQRFHAQHHAIRLRRHQRRVVQQPSQPQQFGELVWFR